MSNTQHSILSDVRKVRAAIGSRELACRIHSVTRVGDAAHAVISIDASGPRGGRVWTTGRMAVLLDTVDGTRPIFRGRTDSAARRVRVLSMVLGRRMPTLAYWVDSSAHFWCADNAPGIYAMVEL